MDLSNFPRLPHNQVYRGLRGGFVNALVDMMRDRGVARTAYSMTDSGGGAVRGKSQSRDRLSWVRCYSDDDIPAFSVVEVYDGRLDSDGIILQVRKVAAFADVKLFAGTEEYALTADGYGWVKLITPYEPVVVRLGDVYEPDVRFGSPLYVQAGETTVIPLNMSQRSTGLVCLASLDPEPYFPGPETGTGTGTGTAWVSGAELDLYHVPVLGTFPEATVRVGYIAQTYVGWDPSEVATYVWNRGYAFGGSASPAYASANVSFEADLLDAFIADTSAMHGALFTGQRILLAEADGGWYILSSGSHTWNATVGGTLASGTGTGTGGDETVTLRYYNHSTAGLGSVVVPATYPLDIDAALTPGQSCFVTFDDATGEFDVWFAGCPVYTE